MTFTSEIVDQAGRARRITIDLRERLLPSRRDSGRPNHISIIGTGLDQFDSDVITKDDVMFSINLFFRSLTHGVKIPKRVGALGDRAESPRVL